MHKNTCLAKCIETSGDSVVAFTIGKIYQINNNCIVDDTGFKINFVRDAFVADALVSWVKFEIIDRNKKPKHCALCKMDYIDSNCKKIT